MLGSSSNQSWLTPKPFSTNRRIASAREGISGCLRRQSSSMSSHALGARISNRVDPVSSSAIKMSVHPIDTTVKCTYMTDRPERGRNLSPALTDNRSRRSGHG